MGFWNNFSRDYFGTGVNKTFRNTLANILLGIKGKKLLDAFGNEQQKTTTPDKTGDTMFNKQEGEPKQDLNKQPVPDYIPPSAGSLSSEEEDALKEQPQQDTQTQQEGNWLLNGFAGGQVPLVTNKQKTKVPQNVLLENIANSERNKFNKDLAKNILEYNLYANRFGDAGTPYTKYAGDLYSKLYQPAPVEPKFDEKRMFNDAQGNLYQYKYNFATGGYDAVPVTGQDQQQIKGDLPKFDEKRLHFEMDENGNAIIRDLSSGSVIQLGKKYEQFDPTFQLKDRELSIEEAYKMGMLDVAQAKLLLLQQKSSGRTGNGDGSSSFNGNLTGSDGVPLELTKRTLPQQVKNFVGYDPETNEPMYQYTNYNKETWGYENANGEFIPKDQVDKFIDDLTAKDTMKRRVAIDQFGKWGFGLSKDFKLIDKKGDKKSYMMKEEIKKAQTQYPPEVFNEYLKRLRQVDQETFDKIAKGMRDEVVKKILNK